MSRPAVVLAAQPFGYGPAAKAVAIAGSLQSHGVRPTFIGRGISIELARRHTAEFSDFLDWNIDQEIILQRILSADAVVSVMDRELCRIAAECGVVYDLVDSLLWLRDPIPTEFQSARRIWSQRFSGATKPDRRHPRIVPVGPILANQCVVEPDRNDPTLVINLGGGESPVAGDDYFLRYAAFILAGFLQSSLANCDWSAVTVLGGARLLDRLRQQYGEGLFRFRSVSLPQARDLFASARLVLTSPGMTTSLDCFGLRAPTWFLPPQNYSQWRILREFQSRGLAAGALHWETLADAHDRDFSDNVDDRNRKLYPLIAGLLADPRAQDAFARSLDDAANQPLRELAGRQSAYLNSLGANGAEEIAATILTEIGTSDPLIATGRKSLGSC